MGLDEWLGSSGINTEGGMLSQKLLKKLGLEGAGKDTALNTRTSADDTADDGPGRFPYPLTWKPCPEILMVGMLGQGTSCRAMRMRSLS